MPASDTQFKKGNKAAAGHSNVPKSFIEKCKGLCDDFENISNPFIALMQVCGGYKGVKPSDRIQAASLLLAYGVGKPKETLRVEQENPFQALGNTELVGVAERLMLAIKSKGGHGDISAEKVIEHGSGTAQSSSS